MRFTQKLLKTIILTLLSSLSCRQAFLFQNVHPAIFSLNYSKFVPSLFMLKLDCRFTSANLPVIFSCSSLGRKRSTQVAFRSSNLRSFLSNDSWYSLLSFTRAPERPWQACSEAQCVSRVRFFNPNALFFACHIFYRYAQLPAEMQGCIFNPTPPGERKCVIATNIAGFSEFSVFFPNLFIFIMTCLCRGVNHYWWNILRGRSRIFQTKGLFFSDIFIFFIAVLSFEWLACL